MLKWKNVFQTTTHFEKHGQKNLNWTKVIQKLSFWSSMIFFEINIEIKYIIKYNFHSDVILFWNAFLFISVNVIIIVIIWKTIWWNYLLNSISIHSGFILPIFNFVETIKNERKTNYVIQITFSLKNFCVFLNGENCDVFSKNRIQKNCHDWIEVLKWFIHWLLNDEIKNLKIQLLKWNYNV